jgi:hypothetical protein
MSLARRLITIAAPVVLPALLAAQTYPMRDARSNLKHGRLDAGEAALNMRLVSFTPKAAIFDTARGLTFINSDLAFKDKYVYQGNFSGFTIWDVSDPTTPKAVSAISCVTSQGDPSIYGNLLFLSAEGTANRNDCAKGGVENPKDNMMGVRIYDVSNPAAPRLVKNVQTCKGSHTHTIVPHPKDKNTIYIYVSGGRDARPDSVMAGCKSGTDAADETNSLFRLDVIKVPLRNPERAEVVTGARRVQPDVRPVAVVVHPVRTPRSPLPRRRLRLVRATVTMSPFTRPSVCSPVRAGATAYSWTSPTPRNRCVSTPRRIQTSRSGTPPSSVTTERRSCSRMSGAAARRRCARPTR